jgi:hypothetical protein
MPRRNGLNFFTELNSCGVNDNDELHWSFSQMSDSLRVYFSPLPLLGNAKELRVNMSDMRLFDIIYYCQNLINGAHAIYELECSNCEGMDDSYQIYSN